MSQNNKTKAFTLVELVVTISIVFMMILVSAPMIFAGDKKKAASTAERVASLFEKARNYSLNPHNKDAVAYTVEFDGSTKFSITMRDEAGNKIALDGAQDSLAISDNYKVSASSNPSFTVGSGKIEGSPVDIGLSKGASTREFAKIKIDESGVVSNENYL